MRGQALVDFFIHKYGRLPTEYDPDYLELLRMSKYRILSRPDVNPAKCANCGSFKDDGRAYVDFGLQVDWFGCVFLCSLCITDIATNMGLFKAHELQILQLETKIEELRGTQISARDLKQTFLKTYEEVKNHFDSLPDSGSSDPSDSDSNMGSSGESAEQESNSAKLNVSGTKSGATKSAPSTGRQNIPELTDILKLN